MQGSLVGGVVPRLRSRPNQRTRCCGAPQILDRQFTCLQLRRSPGAKAGVIVLSAARAAKLLWPTAAGSRGKYP